MGHKLKLVKPRAKLDLRKCVFSNRIVDDWNKLPEGVVQCCTVSNIMVFI